MNEDVFKIQIRKYLKKVGIHSQREIERAVRESLDVGQLSGSETLNATVELKIPEAGIDYTISDTIKLK